MWPPICMKKLITAQLCLLQYFRFTLRQNVISNYKCYVRFQPTYLFLQLYISLLGNWFTLASFTSKLKNNWTTTELLCTIRKLWNKILCHRKERYIWQYLSAYVNCLKQQDGKLLVACFSQTPIFRTLHLYVYFLTGQ